MPKGQEEILGVREQRYIVLGQWVRVEVKVTQSCPTLSNPVDAQSVEFSRPEYWSG